MKQTAVYVSPVQGWRWEMSSKLCGTQSYHVSMLGNEAFNLKWAELGARGWQELQATPPARASTASSHGMDLALKFQPAFSLPGQQHRAGVTLYCKEKDFHKHDLPLSPVCLFFWLLMTPNARWSINACTFYDFYLHSEQIDWPLRQQIFRSKMAVSLSGEPQAWSGVNWNGENLQGQRVICDKVVIQELEKKHAFGPAMTGGRTGLLRHGRDTMNQLGTEKTWPNLRTGRQEAGM